MNKSERILCISLLACVFGLILNMFIMASVIGKQNKLIDEMSYKIESLQGMIGEMFDV